MKLHIDRINTMKLKNFQKHYFQHSLCFVSIHLERTFNSLFDELFILNTILLEFSFKNPSIQGSQITTGQYKDVKRLNHRICLSAIRLLSFCDSILCYPISYTLAETNRIVAQQNMFDLGIQISQITAGHKFRKLGEKVCSYQEWSGDNVNCYISKALCAIYWLCQKQGQIAVRFWVRQPLFPCFIASSVTTSAGIWSILYESLQIQFLLLL